MSTFLYSILLQWKMDLRNKELFVVYYIVPLVFFLFMGTVFTSIMPNAYQTLIQSMTVFGVTMGGVLGTPSTFTELYHSEVKKSYMVGKVPLWMGAVANYLSGFLHLSIMSFLIYLLAPILFDATLPSDTPLYLLSLCLLIALSLAIGSLYGLFIKKSSQLNMVTQFVFLPSVMLSGAMFPKELLPSFLNILGDLFPATWVYSAMNATKFPTMTLLILSGMLLIFFLVGCWKLNHIKYESL